MGKNSWYHLIFPLVKQVLPRPALELLLKWKGVKSIDLTFIKYIRDCEPHSLSDAVYLENKLLPKLGLNDELLHEFPEELYPFCGYGLFHWQYPNQFSKYLVLLSKLKIESYLEIGVRHGGTFVVTVEYLERFNPLKFAIGVDICNCPSLQEYAKTNQRVGFHQMNSISNSFKELVNSKEEIDLVLIDGNHTEDACRNDFDTVKEKANIVVFHDVKSDACPGVVKIWNELKLTSADEYVFVEYTDQYESVKNKTGKSFLGIGVVLKKKYLLKKGISLIAADK